MFEEILQLDRELLIFLNNLGDPAYDGFWLIITNTIFWSPVFLFLLITLFKKFSTKESFVTIGSLIVLVMLTILIVYLFKENVMRLRPNNDASINSLLRQVINPSSYSFISGHATNSMAITIFLVLVFRNKTRLIFLLFLWPILFVASRLYFGVHYPTDILAGSVVGFLLAIVFYRFRKILMGIINI